MPHMEPMNALPMTALDAAIDLWLCERRSQHRYNRSALSRARWAARIPEARARCEELAQAQIAADKLIDEHHKPVDPSLIDDELGCWYERASYVVGARAST